MIYSNRDLLRSSNPADGAQQESQESQPRQSATNTKNRSSTRLKFASRNKENQLSGPLFHPNKSKIARLQEREALLASLARVNEATCNALRQKDSMIDSLRQEHWELSNGGLEKSYLQERSLGCHVLEVQNIEENIESMQNNHDRLIEEKDAQIEHFDGKKLRLEQKIEAVEFSCASKQQHLRQLQINNELTKEELRRTQQQLFKTQQLLSAAHSAERNPDKADKTQKEPSHQKRKQVYAKSSWKERYAQSNLEHQLRAQQLKELYERKLEMMRSNSSEPTTHVLVRSRSSVQNEPVQRNEENTFDPEPLMSLRQQLFCLEHDQKIRESQSTQPQACTQSGPESSKSFDETNGTQMSANTKKNSIDKITPTLNRDGDDESSLADLSLSSRCKNKGDSKFVQTGIFALALAGILAGLLYIKR